MKSRCAKSQLCNSRNKRFLKPVMHYFPPSLKYVTDLTIV